MMPGPPGLLGGPVVMFTPRFVLPDFEAAGNPDQSKRYLECLLRCLTDINVLYLKKHPETPSLYSSGVRYVRDLPGQEDWQSIPEAIARRGADCKTLACWRAAELLVRGHRAYPQFFWRDRDNGATYHIQVQHLDGQIEDPSRILGMRKV